jgi:hypothetical protein
MNDYPKVQVLTANDQAGKLLVNSLHLVQELGISDLVITGAIGLMIQLGEQHRKTFDLDLITENFDILVANLINLGAKEIRETPARYLIPNKITIDVLTVEQDSLNNGINSFANLAKSFAYKDAQNFDVDLPELCSHSHVVKVSSPASLVALKAYEMSERRGANADEAGADAYDITLLISDPARRQLIANKIANFSPLLQDYVIKAIQDCFIRASVLTAAAMRLTQRVKYEVEASQVAVMGDSFLVELQQVQA